MGRRVPEARRCNKAGDVFSSEGDCPLVLPFSYLGASDPSFRSRSQESILHETALDYQAFEEPFYSIPTLLGPSSVGYALAESLATLHNDSDPIPTGSLNNSIAAPEIPELLHSYPNLSASLNELSIKKFFTDDLKLSSKPPELSPRIFCSHQVDNSNDSESFSSSKMPSFPDCGDNSQELCGPSFSHSKVLWEQDVSIKHEYPKECLSGCLDPLSSYPDQAPGIFRLHQKHPLSWPFSCSPARERASEEELTHKDEKRARDLEIPISIDDIVHLAIEEYNEMLAKFELTDEQLNLIRDIRRRGKNKVAAQNCRKRKMDQISSLQQDLVAMHYEKLQLKSKQECLVHEKRLIEEKYAQIHQIVSQFTNCEPSNSD